MLSPIITLLFLEGPLTILPDNSTSRHFLFGVFLSIFSFIQIFSVPFWGKLSIQISKKNILKISFLGNSFSYLICGMGVLNKNINLLFMGVILAGLTGAVIPTINAIISYESSESMWTRNYSLVGSTIGIAFILGPPITGLLMDIVPTENISVGIYILCAFISIINFLIVEFALKTQNIQKKTRTPRSIPFPFREIFLLDSKLKTILGFQFCIYLGWYFFIKFFQVYLIETLKFTDKQSCFGIAFLGLCCATWQAIRYFKNPNIYRYKYMFPSAVFLMSTSIVSFIFINSYLSAMFAIMVLSFAYSMLIPSTISMILNQGQLKNEIKTSVFQSVQSIAKILAPLISGFTISYTSWATAFLGTIVISLAGFLVLCSPKTFRLASKA